MVAKPTFVRFIFIKGAYENGRTSRMDNDS